MFTTGLRRNRIRLSIYEYKDYKKFVNQWLEHSPQKGHGLRKKLAEAIDCQTAYISHVFSGEYQLSQEQAIKCSHWLGLDQDETHYFLLLVNWQRAGSKDLEKYYSQLIGEMRATQSDLKKKSAIKESLSLEDQRVYYSHWLYAAVHIAVTIPQLQTLAALQNYFQIPLSQLNKIIHFLLSTHLLEQEKGFFRVGKAFIHLEKSSPLLIQHLLNWRLKAMDSISFQSGDPLHYSGVLSISEEDYELIREKMGNLLKEIIEVAKKSKEEILVDLNFDWFKV